MAVMHVCVWLQAWCTTTGDSHQSTTYGRACQAGLKQQQSVKPHASLLRLGMSKSQLVTVWHLPIRRVEVHVHAGDKKYIGACWSLNKWKEPKSVPEPPGTFAYGDTRIHVAVLSIAAEFMKLSIVL